MEVPDAASKAVKSLRDTLRLKPNKSATIRTSHPSGRLPDRRFRATVVHGREIPIVIVMAPGSHLSSEECRDGKGAQSRGGNVVDGRGELLWQYQATLNAGADFPGSVWRKP